MILLLVAKPRINFGTCPHDGGGRAHGGFPNLNCCKCLARPVSLYVSKTIYPYCACTTKTIKIEIKVLAGGPADLSVHTLQCTLECTRTVLCTALGSTCCGTQCTHCIPSTPVSNNRQCYTKLWDKKKTNPRACKRYEKVSAARTQFLAGNLLIS